LPRDSVVNVTQLLTLDKSLLCEQIGALPAELLRHVERGVRMLLALG
jgi:mRNA interferase MazF